MQCSLPFNSSDLFVPNVCCLVSLNVFPPSLLHVPEVARTAWGSSFAKEEQNISCLYVKYNHAFVSYLLFPTNLAG